MVRMGRVLSLLALSVLIAACGGGGGGSGRGATPGGTPEEPSPLTPPGAPRLVSVEPAGEEAAVVTWEEVEGADSYAIYWGTAAGLRKEAAVRLPNVQPPHWTVFNLPGGTDCYFAVVAVNGAGESPLSNELRVVPRRPILPLARLNDTGIAWFATRSENFLDAEPVNYGGQDASHGRDARARTGTLEKTGSGAAGFDFTRQGECVRDNVTGMVWAQAGAAMTWTAARTYAESSNLCGRSDWRLPTLEELRTLVHYGREAGMPFVDPSAFPQTTGWHWSVTPAAQGGAAWGIDFTDGMDETRSVTQEGAVLLVAGAALPEPDSCSDTEGFVDYGDGTIVHTVTGLTWKRCAEGQTYDASSGACDGEPAQVDWKGALLRARDLNLEEGYGGFRDWRLPSVKELASIAERRCGPPAVNRAVFPGTPATWFWSSSPHPDGAWGVDLATGLSDVRHKGADPPFVSPLGAVRLVRGGE